MPPDPPAFDVGAIVPSTRDFLQAVRSPKRSRLELVPLLVPEEAAREALRQEEAGVSAVAFAEPGPAMAEAASTTRIAVLCLRPVRAKDDYLAARAFGADAVVIAPELDDASRTDLGKGARSTRMVALELARNEGEALRAAQAGVRGVVLSVESAAAARAIAIKLPPGLAIVAWPARGTEEDVRSLAGAVDAVVVGVDVYGATGFERLVSELGGS